MTNAALRGKPDAGNPHVRFDEGEVAPAKPGRGSLLYRMVGLLALGLLAAETGCVSLNYRERREVRYLESNGIDTAHAPGGFEEPNSVIGAGVLNILPGFGNFYLALGDGNDPVQGVYGVINLLCWPISIVWAAPQAAVDANTLNKREMIYFYTYEKDGIKALSERGLKFE